MARSIDHYRRAAKALAKAHDVGNQSARQRLQAAIPHRLGVAAKPLRHADFLHVVAREEGFDSWPRLKLAAETIGMDRARQQERLKTALFHGQHWVVDALLGQTPDLAEGNLGLQIALFDAPAVLRALAEDRGAATARIGPRRPILHLAYSRHLQAHPEKREDMLAIAKALVAAGADVDDGFEPYPGSDHQLSALYGAIGHADNMALGRWLLERGANPNDNESLYHATELGHHEGLRLLLAHGADPRGTNALLRALDFGDHEAVALLIAAHAEVEDFNDATVGGEPPWVLPALHQAARRMNDAKMVELLLEHGADVTRDHYGATPYAAARVFGNHAMAEVVEARGGATPLSAEETLLARAADGETTPADTIDPAKVPAVFRDLVGTLLPLPGKANHVRRLIEIGMEWDRPGPMGLTPVQIAGWEGMPEMMSYFLSLKPDLGHLNGYGGTLLSTIIHGSENAPDKEGRDHVACARLALVEGVALPRRAVELAGDPEMAEFLAHWADAHPGQLVDHGPA